MTDYQIHQQLNSIVKLESLTEFFGKYFAEQANVSFVLKNDLQKIPKDVRLIPFGYKNDFIGYLILENSLFNNNIWDKVNKYYLEFAAVALRVKRNQQNYGNIKHLDVLNKIQQIANSNLKLTEVFNKIANEIKAIFNFDRLSMSLIDNDKKNIVVYAVYNKGKTSLGAGKKLAIINSAQEWILKNGVPNISDDLRKPIFNEDKILTEEGYRSALRVPLIFKGSIIGAINFNSRVLNAFTLLNAEFALKAAEVLAYSVINSKIIEKKKVQAELIAKENRHLSILNNALHKLSDANDFNSSIKNVLQDIVKEFNLRQAEFYMYANKSLIIENIYHLDSMTEQNIIPNNLIPEIKKGSIIFDEEVNTLYLPIKSHKFLGLMILCGEVKRLYENEGPFIQTLIKQIAIVVENTLLYRSIKYASEFDALSGLYNKKNFFTILRREIARSKRNGESLVLIMADIDNFKSFNDQYGHFTGDKILKHISKVIQESLRISDTAGRFGGEEFLILLPNTDMSDGSEYAKRLLHKIADQHNIYNITISIGLAELNSNVDDAVSLIKKADNALYNAKHNGKNQVVIASKG